MSSQSQTGRAITVRKLRLEISFLVLGRGYVYEGIWPSDQDRHLDWAKHASHNGEMVI